MEGFLIDLRVRCETIENVDVLRPAADEFLTKALKTDAALLYPPSIIALTSCLVAASTNNHNIDKYDINFWFYLIRYIIHCSYIMHQLFQNQSDDAFNSFKSQVKKIRSLVKKGRSLAPPEEIARLKGKLEKCRNPDLTDEKLLVFVDDDDDTISVPVETIATFGNENFHALDF